MDGHVFQPIHEVCPIQEAGGTTLTKPCLFALMKRA